MPFGVQTSKNETFLTNTISLRNLSIFRVWNSCGWVGVAARIRRDCEGDQIPGRPRRTRRVGQAGARGQLGAVITRKSLFSGSSSLSRKPVGPISRRRQMLLLIAWSCCQLRWSLTCLRLSEAIQPRRSILPGCGRRRSLCQTLRGARRSP